MVINFFYRKTLSEVIEHHFEHRKQQVVDLFDSLLEELMKDQMNGFISDIIGRPSLQR